jgi:DNA-binding NarL/FixJ family response regulator
MADDVRILLVDDHAAVRLGARMLLEAVPHFKVVGEAADIPEALSKTEATRPHLAVVDIALGKMNGLLLVRVLHERFPETRVLIWSMYAKPEYVAEAMRAGARGYVLKSGPANEIVIAIEAALVGSYISSGLDKTVIARPILSPAEKQVLVLVAKGLSSREVAKRLKKDSRTVETQRRNIMDKLGATNAVQMVTQAISLGLLDVHEVTPATGEKERGG